MIILNLTGALGNQMFQYALGRHLALKNETELKVYFVNALLLTKRIYMLDCFTIHPSLATNEDLKMFHYPISDTGRILRRVLTTLKLVHGKNIIIQNGVYNFNPSVLRLRGDYFLEGYWQNVNYFKDIETILRKDFIFKKPPQGKNLNYVKLIRSQNSVSLHIRRTDYVTSPLVKNNIQALNIDYYHRAIGLINRKIKSPVYFIFSDDVKWCRENLTFGEKHFFIDYNHGESDYEDMRLMSLCKHNVIANSTFSWWGAWLNANQRKIVISPRKWAKDAASSQLILPQWTSL